MNDDIIKAMRERRSVRAYALGVPLTPVERTQIEKVITEATSPFATQLPPTIAIADFDPAVERRPGTYGVITGASTYLLMGYGPAPEDALAAGFVFEQVVLRATELGLGTCWMAATYRGTDFERKITLPAGQELHIVSPLGAPATKKTLREKLTRAAIGADKRLPFHKLFFRNDWNSPLSVDNVYGEALDLMRLAPSSTNSQPWRVLVDSDNTVHFYYQTKAHMPFVDLGIGMCHFALALQARGILPGAFFTADNPPEPALGLTYLRSYAPSLGYSEYPRW